MKKVLLIAVLLTMMMSLTLQASVVETRTFRATDKDMYGARYKVLKQIQAYMTENGYTSYKPVSIGFEQPTHWCFTYIMVCDFYK